MALPSKGPGLPSRPPGGGLPTSSPATPARSETPQALPEDDFADIFQSQAASQPETRPQVSSDREALEELAERRERAARERFEKSQTDQNAQARPRNNVLPPQAGELDKKGQNVFIDPHEKQVQPFGGKKSSIKVDDLDKRKNIRQAARTTQIVVIFLLIVTLGFAVKNAFFPPMALSEADVRSIVYNTAGVSAFPLEEGGYYAENFMEAYLNYNPKDAASTAALQYFIQGTLAAGGEFPGGNFPRNGFQQKVVYGPKIFKSQGASANSAIYTIGALVEVGTPGSVNGVSGGGQPATTVPGVVEEPIEECVEGEECEPVEETLELPAEIQTGIENGRLQWKFFAINVFYSSSTTSFGIASTPIAVPAPATLTATSIPNAQPYGNGKGAEAAIVSPILPTVYGFLEAWAVSSPGQQTTEKLRPFIGNEPDQHLLTGLNSLYKFKGGAANDRSVSYQAYQTDTSIVKFILTVTWVQEVEGATLEFTSRYVMDVLPTGSAGYVVQRFLPLAFVPKS